MMRLVLLLATQTTRGPGALARGEEAGESKGGEPMGRTGIEGPKGPLRRTETEGCEGALGERDREGPKGALGWRETARPQVHGHDLHCCAFVPSHRGGGPDPPGQHGETWVAWQLPALMGCPTCP